MIAQYTAAALVSENKVLAHPASVDSIPTGAGQEDHVSMGTIAARQTAQIVGNLTHVLALELLCAVQALGFRAPLVPGDVALALVAEIRREVPPLAEDRHVGDDVAAMVRLVRGGRLLAVAEEVVGGLA
jgi:histidine ammonia-lyase